MIRDMSNQIIVNKDIVLASEPSPNTPANNEHLVDQWMLSKGAKIVDGKIVIGV